MASGAQVSMEMRIVTAEREGGKETREWWLNPPFVTSPPPPLDASTRIHPDSYSA